MDNVVELKPQKHCSGEAVCMACGHEEVAIAPTGVVWFECGACHAEKSHFKYPCAVTSADATVLACKCGCQLWSCYWSKGHDEPVLTCPNCGGTMPLSEAWA